jgi:phosphatidylglycerol---prolipoprotein diacylglyceryl transferase
MYPVLFRIGSFAVTSFGVMMFLAFITAAWTLSLQLKRRGMDADFAWDVLGWVAIGGIAGAKLYYLALHWGDVMADPVGELTSRAGLVWYGGFIGGVAAYIWQVRRRKLPLGTTFDAVAPSLALAYGVGRIGCFLVGDDYGLPTNSWVGVAFPHGSPPTTAGYLREAGAHIASSIPNDAIVKVIPTELFESAAGLLFFLILWRLSSRKLGTGQLFGVYLVLYGIERFLIEFVRAKLDRYVLGLTTSQVFSILAVLAGLYLWQRGRQAALSAAAASTAAGGAGATGAGAVAAASGAKARAGRGKA